MGDTVYINLEKDSIYCMGIRIQQFKRVIERWSDTDAKGKVLGLMDSLIEGMLVLLSNLPDEMKLDCKIEEIKNVIIANSQEEAEEVLSQISNAVAGDRSHLH